MRDRKRVLITGSSRGLGRSLAVKFARRGWDLILTGRDDAALALTAAEVRACEVSCEIVQGDLTSNICIINTVDRLVEKVGRRGIDVLINNAGIHYHGFTINHRFEEIKGIIDVNLIATINLTKKIYPYFVAKKEGLIINVNSLAGKFPNSSEAAYCASKFGLRGFMESLSHEAIANNVRILNVYLGAMATEMTKDKEGSEKFIQTEDAADIIYKMSADYKSLRISSIDITRKIY